MNEIVKISKENTQFPVDARELHNKLDVKSRFNDWIINRINQYDFVENDDYVRYSNFSNGKNQSLTNPNPKQEYSITFDMAKELALVENNERGRQIRRYFIKAEQLLREGPLAGKELKSERINGRLMYDYKQTLKVLGLSLRSGSVSGRRRNHFTEFINISGTWFISAEYATMIARNVELRQNYQALAERRKQMELEWEKRQMKFPFWK